MKKYYTKMKMGLYAFNPSEFNIDKKLRPQDPLKLFVKGTPNNQSLKRWISEDPIRIWMKVYKPNEYFSLYNSSPLHEINRLTLCQNTYKLLVESIKKVEPSLIDELMQRRKRKTVFKNYSSVKINSKIF